MAHARCVPAGCASSPSGLSLSLLLSRAGCASCPKGYVDGGGGLLSGGADACIVATDVATGSTVARLENAHATSISRIITLSGNMIASGDDDGCVKIWDTRARTACGEHKPFVDFVSDMKYAGEDRNEIVISSGDGTLGCLNLNSNKMVGQC